MAMGASFDEEVLPPSHRLALADACDRLTDLGLDDLAAVLHGDWPVADSTVAGFLPRRYLARYTPVFLKRFVVCLITVAWKLAQPGRVPLACVAEELAAWALIREAGRVLEERDEAADFGLFTDDLYEDTDFLILFDPRLDGLESSEVGAYLGMGYLGLKDWFVPFGGGDRGAVHPFVAGMEDGER